MAKEIYAGMKLKLFDADDGGVLNTIEVVPSVGQTVEAAYRAAIKQLELKREGWHSVYPNATLKIQHA